MVHKGEKMKYAIQFYYSVSERWDTPITSPFEFDNEVDAWRELIRRLKNSCRESNPCVDVRLWRVVRIIPESVEVIG